MVRLSGVLVFIVVMIVGVPLVLSNLPREYHDYLDQFLSTPVKDVFIGIHEIIFHNRLLSSITVNDVTGFFSSLVFWNNADYSWEQADKVFGKEMGILKQEFPTLKRDTWAKLRATIGNTLQAKEPRHPAVILALIPPSIHPKFGQCFLGRVASAVNKAVTPILFRHRQQYKFTAASRPYFLYPPTQNSSLQEGRSWNQEELEYYLMFRGKAVVVLDLEKFQNQSDLHMLHDLCEDTFLAADPRTTVLLTVKVPHRIFLEYKTEWQDASYDGGRLTKQLLSTEGWESLVDPKVITPELAKRLKDTDAIIVLNDGDKCIDNWEYWREESGKENAARLEERLKSLETTVVQLQTAWAASQENLLQTTANQLQTLNRQVTAMQQKIQLMESPLAPKTGAVGDTPRKTTDDKGSTGKSKSVDANKPLNKATTSAKNSNPSPIDKKAKPQQQKLGGVEKTSKPPQQPQPSQDRGKEKPLPKGKPKPKVPRKEEKLQKSSKHQSSNTKKT